MKKRIKIALVIGLMAGIACVSISCRKPDRGRNLAVTYCGACHQFPEPALLDKASWKNGVLPAMSLRMGMSIIENSPKYSFAEIEKINALHILPEQPMLEKKDWELIVAYYLKNAPDTLPDTTQNQVYKPLDSLFATKKYPFPDSEITMLKYDKNSHRLNVGTRRGEFMQLNPADGRVISQFELHNPATDVVFQQDSSFALTLAGMLEPNHDKSGICMLGTLEKGNFLTKKIITQLARPVSLAVADLNEDGQQDVVVCSFGYFAGRLSWYDVSAGGSPVEHVLKDVAGATRVLVQDLNHDRRPDLMVLMGQGNEGIFIFYNKGKGEFEEEQVLQFPAVYGSLSMELQDFNKDGFLDILYCNGDNGDESPVLKPYHGIRIFINDGKNHFTEKYFFPMHGAIKSVARDFDGDGDLDIASISFFPDYAKSPQQSFVFLRNEGNFKFSPFSTAATDSGRWMVMEALDYDQDGDEDLLLGACYDGSRMKATKVKTPKTTLLLLENKARHQVRKPL